jgi:hypothetical protein
VKVWKTGDRVVSDLFARDRHGVVTYAGSHDTYLVQWDDGWPPATMEKWNWLRREVRSARQGQPTAGTEAKLATADPDTTEGNDMIWEDDMLVQTNDHKPIASKPSVKPCTIPAPTKPERRKQASSVSACLEGGDLIETKSEAFKALLAFAESLARLDARLDDEKYIGMYDAAWNGFLIPARAASLLARMKVQVEA